MPDPAVALSDEQTRELAREILQRPDYAAHRVDPTWLQEWIGSLADLLRRMADWTPQWVIDFWDGFWEALSDLAALAFGDDALVVLLRLALALVVLGAFGLLAYRVLHDLRERRSETDDGEVAVADEGPRLIDDAAAHARDGRFLEAAHCTQLASLQLLLAKKCLELERSDPNRTLRRRLADASLPEPLRGRFLALLDRLEGHWFRDRVEDSDLYREWRALYSNIEALPEAR
jgi:hypothetical protein